jgi:transposase-like protein
MLEPLKKVEEKSPEVSEKASRRRFTKEYKQRILEEADRCTKQELGALYRREGLYSSHLRAWRQERSQGTLGVPRGRKPKAEAKELALLKRQNARLTEKLRQAELIIEVQKKVSELINRTRSESSE